jgi:hypothetical protein
MTAKTRLEVAAHPDIRLRVKMKPLEFQIGGEASFALTTSDIRVHFDEIPITMAIPFLARRVVAGSIGPFGVHVKPFEAQMRAFGLDAHGVFGRDTGEVDLHCTGNCKAEIEISGKLPEELLEAALKKTAEE